MQLKQKYSVKCCVGLSPSCKPPSKRSTSELRMLPRKALSLAQWVIQPRGQPRGQPRSEASSRKKKSRFKRWSAGVENVLSMTKGYKIWGTGGCCIQDRQRGKQDQILNSLVLMLSFKLFVIRIRNSACIISTREDYNTLPCIRRLSPQYERQSKINSPTEKT